MADPLLSVENITFSYGAENVIRNLSALFSEGMVYGILGANGSGKTTLLDMLCGMLPTLSGQVRFMGKDIRKWKRRDMARRMALVPQEFSIPFDFTVRQVVEMGRHPWLGRFSTLSANDRETVNRVMDELSVASLENRLVTRLSGGEKQRVVTARALAQTPCLVLLDESTSNLDIKHTISILDVLKRRSREEGLTVIAAMHDMNAAAMFCDELLVLKGGSVIASGPVESVLTEEMIRSAYGVESHVETDAFSGAPRVSFRLEGAGC
jgi:iron complex transport system ATP-binding protein